LTRAASVINFVDGNRIHIVSKEDAMRTLLAALSFCLTVLTAPSASERAAATLATDNAQTVSQLSLDKGSCIGVLDAAVCDQGVPLDPAVQASVKAKLAERQLMHALSCTARVYLPLFRPDPGCDAAATSSLRRDLGVTVHAWLNEARTKWQALRSGQPLRPSV
jgi:hypothetical protein